MNEKLKLVLSGRFKVREDSEEMRVFKQIQEKFGVITRLDQFSGHYYLTLCDVFPAEEDLAKDFLQEVGSALPGFLVGELEVWWPYCVESGPQWWTLEEDGVLKITESSITREEPYTYRGT